MSVEISIDASATVPIILMMKLSTWAGWAPKPVVVRVTVESDDLAPSMALNTTLKSKALIPMSKI